ncbi:MAG: KH domain-containing protein [Candidatus Thermoplasmatota archaeon]|jgi:ribosomal RNA assembly protein|nr:KH domain-containing protein [Candidatus Thermoplasmatota archaeon]
MEHLCRVPRDRIAVLIGKSGETRRLIGEACGGEISIDSQTGDVSIEWKDEPDPVRRMKAPDVITAIGRGIAPSRAVQLLEDEVFLRMYDIREWVGKQPNQTRRMRSRLIGTNGRIRTLIEELTGCEISIYGSTVAVIGDNEGLALATPAIEGILGGSEHGTVLYGLEQDRKRQRLRSKNLDSFQDRTSDRSDSFEAMVPGFSEAREKRMKSEPLELEDGESISYGEE